MKRILTLLAFIPFIAAAQTPIVWSEPVTVNSNTAYGNTRPRIVLTKSDIPVVMWGKGNDQGVYVSRFDGSGFSPAIQVTPGGLNAFVQNWAGPDIAASGDTVFVTFKAQPEDEGVNYIVRSADGGASFGDTVRISDDNWSRFPALAVRPGGNPVVAYMQFDHHFTDPRYVVAVSNDGGNTFTAPVDGTGSAEGEMCDCCPGYVMAAGSRIILLFRNNDNDLRDMWASVSENSGASFTKSADIDDNNWIVGVCPSTGPDAIANGDNLVAVWMSGASGYSRINMGTVNLSTMTPDGSFELTPSSTGNQNYPRIAGNGDVWGVVWQESAMGTFNIRFAYTTTGVEGIKESTPVNVNPTSGVKFNPDVVYSNGTFHIVWQDVSTGSVMYRKAVLPALGVAEKEVSASVTIYPSPAQEMLYLNNLPATNTIILTDATGRRQVIQNASSNLNISRFASGLFLVEVYSDGKLLAKSKVVKQ